MFESTIPDRPEKAKKSQNATDPYLEAIKLLARRDYSRVKLRKKLETKGFEKAEIEPTLTNLEEEGYLKEHAYIDARVRGFMHKGWSPLHIKRKLAEEELDVSLETIGPIFHRENVSEEDQIQWLLNKKCPTDLPTLNEHDAWDKIKNKLLRTLASKGHQPQKCFEAVNSFIHKLKSEHQTF